MKNTYCLWKTRRYVIHDTLTDEFMETDSIRWVVSIIAEHVQGWTRGQLWELVKQAIRTGELVHIEHVVFIDTQA